MRELVKGYIAAFISAVTYGMIPLFMIPIKQEGFSVDVALFYRFIISAVCLGGYLIYRKESLRFSLREGLLFVVLGILYALSAEFLFIAYDLLTPGIASTIFFMYPLIVALGLALFFGEHLTVSTLLALVMVLIGVFFLSVKDIHSLSINYLGAFVSLLGALVYALYMLIVQKGKLSASGIKVSFYSTLFSAVYFVVKVYITGHTLVIPDAYTSLLLTGFSLITTLLSLVTLVYAIWQIGSTPTSIIGVMEPLVAVAISIWVYHQEELTYNLIIGVVLIAIAVIIDIYQRSTSRTGVNNE